MCFTARAAFYCAALPLWEGFDEWAHFAVIQRMALRGELLVSRQSPISREIEASLKLAPVPWELRYLPPPSLTDDAYWHLPADERGGREAAFHSLPRSWASEDAAGGLTAYEALQSPLYYWIAAPLARASRNADLGTRVLLLRWLSIAIASLVVPFSFLVGRCVFRSPSLALGCAAVVAAMPGFMIDVARIGNDCAAVALLTLLTWLIVESVDDEWRYARALYVGIVLGLGLLTKAYFLAAVPPVALLLIYEAWRARGGRLRAFLGVLIAGVASFSIAGWWYVRNLLTTGTLSGMGEAAVLHQTMSQASILRRAGEIHWLVPIDAILLSHLWFGGWSSLTIRSWMYHLFYVVIALAAIGLVRLRRRPDILALVALYATFWVAQLYNALLLFVGQGVATSMGWYMYAVVAAEVALCVAGLRAISPASWRRQVSLAGVLLFVLLDLYTLQGVAIPYYTGLIAHRSNGSLAPVHFSDFTRVGISEIFFRLTAYKTDIMPVPALTVLWGAYVLATIALVLIGFACRSKTD
jgi:4-amino-4-deoxy-L-arabinose transferase-like glycosyltransferase